MNKSDYTRHAKRASCSAHGFADVAMDYVFMDLVFDLDTISFLGKHQNNIISERLLIRWRNNDIFHTRGAIPHGWLHINAVFKALKNEEYDRVKEFLTIHKLVNYNSYDYLCAGIYFYFLLKDGVALKEWVNNVIHYSIMTSQSMIDVLKIKLDVKREQYSKWIMNGNTTHPQWGDNPFNYDIYTTPSDGMFTGDEVVDYYGSGFSSKLTPIVKDAVGHYQAGMLDVGDRAMKTLTQKWESRLYPDNNVSTMVKNELPNQTKRSMEAHIELSLRKRLLSVTSINSFEVMQHLHNMRINDYE